MKNVPKRFILRRIFRIPNNEPVPEDYREILELMYLIYSGKKYTDTNYDENISLPEELDLFYRIMCSKKDFMNSVYIITERDKLDNGKQYITFASESHGVCEYQIGISEKMIYYKSSGCFEKIPMSLENFLIYLTALQMTGLLNAQAYISNNEKSDKFFAKISLDDKIIFVNLKRKIIGVDMGEKILIAAKNDQAIFRLEEQCGLRIEYILENDRD